ncbi:hypothetical protein BJ138DRAFT_1115562 [Hygrophoropsis aurantiaca]|uniref:Uncharacterized protein n=1 Tax=Hygrophoropsis aurantiaca TaxID=72124 RepID=A0ACB8A6E0_9AGAM|nr:hypothetical protein BJ138DRAFT_1115562 [Hygrophoropsis aurantiaca]
MSSLYPPFFTVAILLASLQAAAGQGVATCQVSTGYQWANNDKGQDPCSVAQFLFAPNPGPCNTNDITFPPIASTTGNTSYYQGPNINTANACLCNTVIYSLASACGLCQGGTLESWSQWTSACPAGQILLQQWPSTVPSNTEIPLWAYLATSGGQWDSVDSKTNATAVTAAESSSSVAAASKTSSAAAASQTGSTSSKKSSSDTGAIAGGVVGGVVAVAIIGFLGVYFWRRRSRPAVNPLAPRISAYSTDYGDKPYSVPDSQPTFTKLYDPNDPSTFPRSPAPLSQNTESSNGISEAIAGRGQYHGAPEV